MFLKLLVTTVNSIHHNITLQELKTLKSTLRGSRWTECVLTVETVFIWMSEKKDNNHTYSLSCTQTSRGHAATDGSVEAGLTDTWIRIEHAAQFHLTQPGYLRITAPLILEWQLVTVQHQ